MKKKEQQLIDELMTEYADKFYVEFQAIEQEYLNKIAKRLKDVGDLNSVDMTVMANLTTLINKDLKDIQSQLIDLSNRSQKEIEDMCLRIADEHSNFASTFYNSKGIAQVSLATNKSFQTYITALARQNMGNFKRLSLNSIQNTNYQQILNKAVLNLSGGISSPQAVIRTAIRESAQSGLYFVEYESGRKRRLDSAIRMNILDTANQINIESAKIVGEEYGADGVEISAHSNPAPDHKDIQGKQYTNAEYEKLNSRLNRSIGTKNCYHFAFPILVGVSEPTYSKKELETMRKNGEAKINIDGVSKTKYEWTQEQRKIESRVRYQKEIANMAKITGDRELRESAQYYINEANKRYDYISKNANIDTAKERMTVSGFRQIKISV